MNSGKLKFNGLHFATWVLLTSCTVGSYSPLIAYSTFEFEVQQSSSVVTAAAKKLAGATSTVMTQPST